MTNDVRHAPQSLHELILQATARGWCSPENSGKVMDTELASAIAAEVEKAVDEHYAIKFAAIMTASIQNTPESAKHRIGRDNPYWTVAYSDVCTAVDREMKLLARLSETGAMREALHASAPPDHKCADCTMDKEPCPSCYSSWWSKRHPNTVQIGGASPNRNEALVARTAQILADAVGNYDNNGMPFIHVRSAREQLLSALKGLPVLSERMGK